jgi:hypothetical protein
VDRAKMSVADMLAAARAGGSAPAAAPTPAKPQAAAETAPIEVPDGEPASAGGESVKKPASEKLDKKSMSIDQMLAWCRQHDS